MSFLSHRSFIPLLRCSVSFSVMLRGKIIRFTILKQDLSLIPPHYTNNNCIEQAKVVLGWTGSLSSGRWQLLGKLQPVVLNVDHLEPCEAVCIGSKCFLPFAFILRNISHFGVPNQSKENEHSSRQYTNISKFPDLKYLNGNERIRYHSWWTHFSVKLSQCLSVFIIKDKMVHKCACLLERGYNLATSLSPRCLPSLHGLSLGYVWHLWLQNMQAGSSSGPTSTTGNS